MAKQVGGHGGMDFLMDWRTIDCLRNGLPLDIDVYDAAAWSAVAPLSEWSVANHSNSINDFTWLPKGMRNILKRFLSYFLLLFSFCFSYFFHWT